MAGAEAAVGAPAAGDGEGAGSATAEVDATAADEAGAGASACSGVAPVGGAGGDDCGEEDEGTRTTIREQLAKERLFRRREEQDPLAVGRWVRVRGLQAEHLNGLGGQVVAAANGDGRVGVQLPGVGGKLVRAANLEPFGEAETVKVARLFARGERGTGVRTWRWPVQVLHDRACDLSPVSLLIGEPLYLMRVEPDRELLAREDFENQWATRLMLDPETGQVPMSWQAMVGAVVVWRECGLDFSAEDLCLVAGFAAGLPMGRRRGLGAADEEEEQAEAEPGPEAATPEAFERYKRRELACDPLDPDADRWWEDVNL